MGSNPTIYQNESRAPTLFDHFSLVHKLILPHFTSVYHKGKFVLFNDASRSHWFSYHWLLDVKHMVIVTYFFRGNLLLSHRLLFLISSKQSLICIFSHTWRNILQPLLDQLWTSGSRPIIGSRITKPPPYTSPHVQWSPYLFSLAADCSKFKFKFVYFYNSNSTI